MPAAVDMEDHEVQISPQTYARIGGALYLIIIVIGFLGEFFVRDRLIVSGDPAATAEKIRASEFLWRVGIAGELFLLICAVAVALILYVLIRPVSRDLALLAAFFNLVSISIEATASLYLMETLFPLGSANYLKALDPKQLHALAYLSTRSHGYGFGVALIFFGCFCLVIGYSDFQIGLLPQGYRRSDADRRSVLSNGQLRADSFSFTRKSTLPRHPPSCACWGVVTLPVAADQGRERLEMEGTSERGACTHRLVRSVEVRLHESRI